MLSSFWISDRAKYYISILMPDPHEVNPEGLVRSPGDTSLIPITPQIPPSPDKQKQGRRIVIAVLSSNLFGLLLWGVNQFLSLRGVLSVEASRIVLVFIWLIGVVMGWLIVWVCAMKKQVLVVGTCAIILAAMLLALDRWAPKPKFSPELKSPETETETVLKHPSLLVSGWGLFPPNKCRAVINTEPLLPLRKDFMIMLAANLQDNTVEPMQDARIEKSNRFLISGEPVTIEIELSRAFMNRMFTGSTQGGHRTFEHEVTVVFWLIIIPNGVQTSQIVRLSDVDKLGGKVLTSKGAGEMPIEPPSPTKEPSRPATSNLKSTPKNTVEMPDVSLRFVYPKSPALLIVNTSDSVARDIKWGAALWNMDLPERDGPLPIPTGVFDWIKPHEQGGPQDIFGTSSVATLLKPGNRLFGSVAVDCATCSKGRTYVVYIVWNQGGWFSEFKWASPGDLVIPRKVSRDFREPYFKQLEGAIPVPERIPIGDWP